MCGGISPLTDQFVMFYLEDINQRYDCEVALIINLYSIATVSNSLYPKGSHLLKIFAVE